MGTQVSRLKSRKCTPIVQGDTVNARTNSKKTTAHPQHKRSMEKRDTTRSRILRKLNPNMDAQIHAFSKLYRAKFLDGICLDNDNEYLSRQLTVHRSLTCLRTGMQGPRHLSLSGEVLASSNTIAQVAQAPATWNQVALLLPYNWWYVTLLLKSAAGAPCCWYWSS